MIRLIKSSRYFLSHHRNGFRMLALGLLLMAGAIAVWAQSGAGRIQGVVLDSTGAAIPNAQVVIRNGATGQEYKTDTNATGFYTAPSLFTGSYSLTVNASGMAEYKVTIQLNAGQTAVVNPQLNLATVSQQVTVAADVISLASYNDQTVSTTLELDRINDLPSMAETSLLSWARQPPVSRDRWPTETRVPVPSNSSRTVLCCRSAIWAIPRPCRIRTPFRKFVWKRTTPAPNSTGRQPPF